MKNMKYLKLIMLALICGMTLTTCMDADRDDPNGTSIPYGNNSIKETNLKTIAEVREMFKDKLNTSYAYEQVTEPIQIKGYVTGNDVQGNIYNEIALQDETGAINLAIAQGVING